MSIVNRVAESGLIQFDPATLIKDMVVSVVSLSDFLHEESILREKPFRQAITAHDWTHYSGQYVAIQIDQETLVPQWAAMLVTSCLLPHVEGVCLGNQGSALDMAYVAAGRYDGYFQNHLNLWDIAAGIILVKEAGGMLNEIDLSENKKIKIIASSSDINSKFLQKLGNF